MSATASKGLLRAAAFSYIGQLYTVAIGFLAVPVYVRYLGSEAYGLVGFYASLQAWFLLLDLGMSQTLAREVARCRGGAISADEFQGALRLTEYVVYGLAVVGAVALALLAPLIATRWLNLGHLSVEEVVSALRMMAAMVALRWVSGVYRSLIVGCEQQAWMGGFNVFSATLRFGLVLGVIIALGANVTNYFASQLSVSVLEAAVLVSRAYALLPKRSGAMIGMPLARAINLLKFSGSVVTASVLWTLVTQVDKVWLSRALPLKAFGDFSIATLLASGLSVATAPIGTIVIPRLTRLYAEKDIEAAIGLYSRATQWTVMLVAPLAVTLALFPREILFAWSGSAAIADQSGAVLRCYAIGNALVAIASFPYFLQYAAGSLKLHLLGNLLILPLFCGLLGVLFARFGVVGAGVAWLATNAIYTIGWIPVVHGRYLPRRHAGWIGRDVLLPTSIAIVAGGLVYLAFRAAGRPWPLVAIGLTAVFATGGAVLSASEGRRFLRERVLRFDRAGA